MDMQAWLKLKPRQRHFSLEQPQRNQEPGQPKVHRKPYPNNPALLLKPIPVQQEKVRHPMLHPHHHRKRSSKGILVRVGIHQNCKQVVQPQKPRK